MTEQAVVLDAKGITKQFPGVLANDRVDFDLKQGEIHALLGENGAGKTTLMNILYGLYKADSGEITVNGVPVSKTVPERETITFTAVSTPPAIAELTSARIRS